MVEIGEGSGEYLRRKWETDAPDIPLPMMQTVEGGGGEEREWAARGRRRRRERRHGRSNDGGFMVEVVQGSRRRRRRVEKWIVVGNSGFSSGL